MAGMDTVLATKSERKPRGQGASRRGEILDAAKRLFLTEGFERATIRKIAASVGVSSAALYLYFPDKDAILRAIAEFDVRNPVGSSGRVAAASRYRPGAVSGRAAGVCRVRAGASGRVPADVPRQDDGIMRTGPAAPIPASHVPAADRSFDILANSIAAIDASRHFSARRPGPDR